MGHRQLFHHILVAAALAWIFYKIDPRGHESFHRNRRVSEDLFAKLIRSETFFPAVNAYSTHHSSVKEFSSSVEKYSQPYISSTRDPIDTRDLVRMVERLEDAAVAIFEGIVPDRRGERSVTFYEYESYEVLALRLLDELRNDLKSKYPISEIFIAHRLGRINVGEVNVIIAVSARHNRAALKACSEAIERLRRGAPIWKKEHFVNGEAWAEGYPFALGWNEHDEQPFDSS